MILKNSVVVKIVRDEIKYNLKYLREYSKYFEELLDNKIKEIELEINDAEVKDIEERQNLIDEFNESRLHDQELNNIGLDPFMEFLKRKQQDHRDASWEEKWYAPTNVFPAMLRSSFFVAMYSFVENKLNQLCIVCLKHINKTNKQYKIFGVYKAKKYLEKEMNCNFPQWEEINNYRLIRNKIVHHSGKIKNTSKSPDNEIKNFIASKTHISLDDDGIYSHIRLEKDFAKKFIDTVEDMFNGLFSQILK